ncbi:PAS domain-containing sensor histidine kinase [Mesorhizobium abyssinicae]|uniref:PAS domain-containing sensor histidine kinase n=1 Tax=Mesorhizobium abyssinicae TaxID=1209958 RepID=UPI0033907A31
MSFELSDLIDALPGLAWSALPDGCAELLNQSWHDYTGFTAEEAADRGWIHAIHLEDRLRVDNCWSSCVSYGEPRETEARLRRRDGVYRWFLFRANPFRDKAGNISRWLGFAIDIEDFRHREEPLQSSERNLSLIINTIPSHIYVLNTEGFVQYVNQAVMDYTGLTLEDVQQEDYRDRVIHPEDFKRVREGRAASLKRTTPFSTEQRVLGKDGEYRWFLVRYKPLLDEQGRITRWYVAAVDIEDHKRALDQLQLLVNMMHAMPAAVWSVTPDGTPDIVNQSLYDYIGQTPEYVHRHPEALTATIHPDDLGAARKTYWEGIRSGSGFAMEVRFLRARDQTYRWHLNQAIAIRDQEGNIIRFLGNSTDIDDLRVAQEELQTTRASLAHVSRLITMGELTASIAHEITQPLTGIVINANACLRILAADQPDLERARGTARLTIRDAGRMSDVISHLRAMFANKKPAVGPIDLAEATEEVIALCGSDLRRKGALLFSEFSNDLPVVVGDRIQLQQVILNLLTNAADAMLTVDDRPRELSIKIGIDADTLVRVTVRDSGVGFESSGADKLFAPFFSTKPQGMGIGLSVSRSIIESHHGRIWAERNEGSGATFAFAIPRSPAPTE